MSGSNPLGYWKFFLKKQQGYKSQVCLKFEICVLYFVCTLLIGNCYFKLVCPCWLEFLKSA